MKCPTHRGIILEMSEKLNPVSGMDVNIDHCPDRAPEGAPHIARDQRAPSDDILKHNVITELLVK